MADKAPHVHDCERSSSSKYFVENCRDRNIDLNSLSDETHAICTAILSAGDYVADMIAASHHDTHGTQSVSEIE